jgi:uncharacterized repeat protein (TIGR03803 family)
MNFLIKILHKQYGSLLCVLWIALLVSFSGAQEMPARGGTTNPQTLTTMYTFTGGKDGAVPWAELIRDAKGNLYSTTKGGGASGYGTVFKVNPKGKETVLWSFTGGQDGGTPLKALIRDDHGNLYGTSTSGGASGQGTIFKIGVRGEETTLYSFTGGVDGRNPRSALIRDTYGNLYGTTANGGTGTNCPFDGCGTVYKLDTKNHETVLYSFTGGSDGQCPFYGLVRDKQGNFYGTTVYGGFYGEGVVFKLDTKNNETVLYSFTGGADGALPYFGVILDAEGNLYGAAQAGGNVSQCKPFNGCGVVYKVDQKGKETVLYTFSGGKNGAVPNTVIRDSSGNLYGTTWAGGNLSLCDNSLPGCGVVFKVNERGKETVLHSFTGGADGANSNAAVIVDAKGNLYGTESSGGLGFGTVWKLAP